MDKYINLIGNDWDNVLQSVWQSDGFKLFLNKIKDLY